MAESNQDGSQISINFEDGNLASDGENFPMDWNIFDLSQEEISGGDSISFNLEGLDVEREETWNFEDLPFDQRSITSSMSWNVIDVGIDDLSVSSHDGIVEDEITEPPLESNELDHKEESELQECSQVPQQWEPMKIQESFLMKILRLKSIELASRDILGSMLPMFISKFNAKLNQGILTTY